MLKHLIIADNPVDPSTWERIDVESVGEALMQRYDRMPDNARLYKDNVSKANDITPRNQDEIEALETLEGTFYFVNYPQGVLEIIAIVVVALVAIAAIVLRPKVPPIAASRNVQSQSPNNALSGRTNAIRINGRIPDIFGTVRSTPDLISVPYSVFENNIEVEYTYMCIGRGSYGINADDCRDGQTPIEQIDGSSLMIYGPQTSPNFPGVGPQLVIGELITRPLIAADRSKSVNGQTLLASNDNAFSSSSDTFNFGVYPDGHADYVFCDSSLDLTANVHAGDMLTITDNPAYIIRANWNFDNNVPTFNLVPEGSLAFTDFAMRFYANGRIEFQTLTGIGTGDHPMNYNGVGYMELANATVTDGTHTVALSGKYVVNAYSDTTLLALRASDSQADWPNISAFAGGVTPWQTCSIRFPSNVPINVSGTYLVASVDHTNELTLTYPDNVRVNNDWAWFPQINTYHQIENRHAFLNIGLGSGWVGPFVLDVTSTSEIISNYIAEQGMYKDDGTTQTSTSVDIQLGATPCNTAGLALGPEQYFVITMTGPTNSRGTCAVTLFADVIPVGRYMVRSRRLTPKDLLFTGQIADEVKWRDVYSSTPVGAIAFGDITTAYCVTHATQSALAVSERQINMLVSRLIPLRITGSAFTTVLHPTSSADEIISFICLDPKIGNRQPREINFDNVYSTIAQVKDYFGLEECGEFNYTIDSDNLSFEETLVLVADAAFCGVHRRNGDLIELNFERSASDSVLLFNHRNKVPGSETRTVTFGNTDDYDGIEYEYVSPIDDSVTTFYIPADRTAVKPQKITSVGVRSDNQAYLHAYRLYNKQAYQTTAVQFDATQEADLISIGDRILVADNTRPDTQDGEIASQDGLILTLSQPVVVKPDAGYIISLQLASGIVENIAITEGDDPYHVILGTAPTEALVTGDNGVTKTQFQIVRVEDTDSAACLVATKTPNSNFTYTLEAINYDERYYANDKDFRAHI